MASLRGPVGRVTLLAPRLRQCYLARSLLFLFVQLRRLRWLRGGACFRALQDSFAR